MKILSHENPIDFFRRLKQESEEYWANTEINKTIYGFQIQKGTKWLPGLDSNQIAEYESEIGFGFPNTYKDFLLSMNGTDKETVNVYGNSGYSYAYGVGYYSYPRDLEIVKEQIKWIYDSFGVTAEDIETNEIPHIMPIVSHRFLVIDRHERNLVLSMYGDDVIPYSSSLQQFLIDDIFNNHQQETLTLDTLVKFWIHQ